MNTLGSDLGSDLFGVKGLKGNSAEINPIENNDTFINSLKAFSDKFDENLTQDGMKKKLVHIAFFSISIIQKTDILNTPLCEEVANELEELLELLMKLLGIDDSEISQELKEVKENNKEVKTNSFKFVKIAFMAISINQKIDNLNPEITEEVSDVFSQIKEIIQSFGQLNFKNESLNALPSIFKEYKDNPEQVLAIFQQKMLKSLLSATKEQDIEAPLTLFPDESSNNSNTSFNTESLNLDIGNLF